MNGAQVYFDSRDVASYIAQECRKKNIVYTNSKIQTFLFCAYGLFLAERQERICNEFPRAWDYGPAFPKVYKCFRKNCGIMNYSDTVVSAEEAEEIRDTVALTLRSFGRFGAVQLTDWVMKKGSPWFSTVYGSTTDENTGLYKFIPDDLIRNYFSANVLPKL